jgi:glucose/mannose-6-phosphate isomerase
MKEFVFSSSVARNLSALPEIIEGSLNLLDDLEFLPFKKRFRQLVIAGMGGSGIAGEILRTVASARIKIPIFVISEATLPPFVDQQTLVIICSYSGNTLEMIQLFRTARRRRANLVVVSSGGTLGRLCNQYQVPLVALPVGLQPRAALGFFLVPIFYLLGQCGLFHFEREFWRQLARNLKLLRKKLKRQGLGLYLEKIAQRLAKKIPVILAAASTTAAAGYRFKTQLNENAKAPALVAVFPELTHNEIMNLASLPAANNFCPIFLESSFDSRLIRKMQRAVRLLLKKNFMEIFVLKARGRTLLEQILYLVFLVDLISIRVALVKKVDPTPVFFINRVKELVRR